MSTSDLYVMIDENFGNDYFITSWEDFKAECAELGWDASEANLIPLDEYLEQDITKIQAQNLEQSAKNYGVWGDVVIAHRHPDVKREGRDMLKSLDEINKENVW